MLAAMGSERKQTVNVPFHDPQEVIIWLNQSEWGMLIFFVIYDFVVLAAILLATLKKTLFHAGVAISVLLSVSTMFYLWYLLPVYGLDHHGLFIYGACIRASVNLALICFLGNFAAAFVGQNSHIMLTDDNA